MDPDNLAVITAIGPMIGIGIVSISAGWVLTTWMRIKNGYPLDGAWGQAVYPKNDQESLEHKASHPGKCPTTCRTRINQRPAR